MFSDLRYGLRMLIKSPGFTAVAVLALALGIGANTATFSLADAILLRPLLLKDLERLVIVADAIEGAATDFNQPISPADFLDFREQSKTLDHLSAYTWWNANLTGSGDPERVQGFLVTADFFEALGEKPLLGRTFFPNEDQPGLERVVVLGHGLWERRYGADPKVLGSTVELNGQSYQVIGVMPKDFRYPAPAELWAPLPMTPQYRITRGAWDLYGVARLKPGVSLQH